jgi:hypothetical protein
MSGTQRKWVISMEVTASDSQQEPAAKVYSGMAVVPWTYFER